MKKARFSNASGIRALSSSRRLGWNRDDGSVKTLRLLPSEFVAPKMSIAASFLINRLFQIQLLNDFARAQVKVVTDNLVGISSLSVIILI